MQRVQITRNVSKSLSCVLRSHIDGKTILELRTLLEKTEKKNQKRNETKKNNPDFKLRYMCTLTAGKKESAK
jgi:predicted RNA-binding protein with RPS1 domain